MIPVEEYLSTSYDPDREFIEGLVERSVGEIDHGDAQGRTTSYILTQCTGFWPGVEIRVQVKPNRFRIPDVIVIKGGKPGGRIVRQPPLVVVEVLSPDDRARDLQEKIDD